MTRLLALLRRLMHHRDPPVPHVSTMVPWSSVGGLRLLALNIEAASGRSVREWE